MLSSREGRARGPPPPARAGGGAARGPPPRGRAGGGGALWACLLGVGPRLFRGVRGVDDVLVVLFVLRNDPVAAEPCGGVPPAGFGHAVVQTLVGQEGRHARRLPLDIADGLQKPFFAVGD